MVAIDPVVVSSGSTARSYLALTKPRIIELLLVTTVPVMMIAAGGWPGTWLVVATVAGGSFSAGGANVLNNVFDRDIDQIMERTASRPLPATEIEPRDALVFGIGLGVLGFAWLTIFSGLLAASLSTGALLFYVLVYTMILKRRTAYNIVIGGAAGAVPVLVGWAAVTGSVSIEALLLFAVVCLWTPPHFWALAIRYRDDYGRAGVPMLPVVAGIEATIRQMKWYTVATVVASLMLGASDAVGLVYLAAALIGGVWFLVGAARLREDKAMKFFHLSISYLTILFAGLALDAIVSL